jgi:hypothetical protein
MKKIKLTQGKWALVSDEDYEYLNQWKWYAGKCNSNIFYAARGSSRINGKRKTVRMHRVIAERIGIKNPDHRDRDGLNNQRNNLREATLTQQKANRRNNFKNNTSEYKGVYWDKKAKKWRAYICINKKCIYLGLFINIKDAARVYNMAAIKHFGEFAVLNKI